MKVKTLMEARFGTDGIALLSQGVANGYRALDSLMKHSPVFSDFYPGRMHRGYLLGIFVQHGLDQIAAQSRRFFSSVKPNSSRNHYHAHFQTPSGVHFTALYRGKDGTRGVRPALYRAALCSGQGDLFQNQSGPPELPEEDNGSTIYAQLLHGGWEAPKSILLAIPDANQRTFSLMPFSLPLVEAIQADAEAIAESFMFTKPKVVAHEQHDGAKEAG